MVPASGAATVLWSWGLSQQTVAVGSSCSMAPMAVAAAKEKCSSLWGMWWVSLDAQGTIWMPLVAIMQNIEHNIV